MDSPNSQYKTTVRNEHWRNEEFQWVRVLATGNAAKGMVLVYLQKACTAFHEFEPALKAGALDESQLDFFRKRLANRLNQLLTTMRNNALDSLKGTSELEEILRSVESAATLHALGELAEELHVTGHTLLDALERA